MNQTDDGFRAKDTKGITGSAPLDKPHASSPTTERVSASGHDDELAGETRTGLESSSRQTDVGSGPQDQGPLPISGLMFVSDRPQVVDQTDIQTETEPHALSDEASVNMGSQHSLISRESSESFTTVPEAFEGRSSASRVGAASDHSLTRQSHPAEPQANHGGPPPVPKDVVPAASLTHQDPGIPRLVQASVEKTSPEGTILVAKAETVKDDGEPVDHSVSNQTARPAQSPGDHDALGASPEQSFSHGRQPGNEGFEQFGELWSGHNGRQMETGEPKISRSFVVDHAIVTGSVAPGVSTQAISVPGTPAPTPVVTQVQSGLRAEEMAQPAGVPGMRSVVVNVAQPDLGHVNIRVAMANDVVHTHLSADRLEVGQFFVNGQDRLQTALQANGLDLGQFRVDIDRQSGGRSSQQGSSQEHDQPWSQGSHGMGQEPHAERQDQTRGALHGLLNVIA